MRKDVTISICGKPKVNGGEPEVIELTTLGKLYRKNGSYYIIYKESELTGFEGQTTTLKVEPERVTMLRSGGSPSSLVFEKGKRHFGLYNVPEGTFTVAVSTSRLIQELSDAGGSLDIDYSVEINSRLASENKLSVRIRS